MTFGIPQMQICWRGNMKFTAFGFMQISLIELLWSALVLLVTGEVSRELLSSSLAQIHFFQPAREARRLAQRAERPVGVLRRRLLHRNGNFVPLAP